MIGHGRSGDLSHGRLVAGKRGAAHVARLVRGKGPGAMHGSTVVPHHQVANAPGVGVDELPLGGVLGHVGEGGGQAVLLRRAQARADGVLELTQAAAEGELLLVVDRLVMSTLSTSAAKHGPSWRVITGIAGLSTKISWRIKPSPPQPDARPGARRSRPTTATPRDGPSQRCGPRAGRRSDPPCGPSRGGARSPASSGRAPAPPGLGARPPRSARRGARSPRRGSGPARPSGTRARSPRAGAGPPRAACRARPPPRP